MTPVTSTDVVHTSLSGFALLSNPLLNKGTAFSDQERTLFGLHGLLPPHIGTLEEQTARRLKALRALPTSFQKYSFLRDLQDINETLFYALLTRNIEEIMPLVYTPTVGEGCQRFSEIFRRSRGVFLSYPNRRRMREILAHKRYNNVRVIVVSDGERILGLGDQGAGGMGIPIGKLALYTACGGIRPEQTLPILLDVGTDNHDRRDNPQYIGWNHERIRGEAYDEFVDDFVAAVIDRWPFVLLQWEDFAGPNAARFLEKYRDKLCTFNDDIQGTAAVATGTILAAVNVTGIPLKEQRVAMVGMGGAGVGISSLMVSAMMEQGLTEEQALRRFYCVGRDGLIVDGPTVRPSQKRYAQPAAVVADWKLRTPGSISLLDVVENARPTVLLGVSGQAGIFDEQVCRAMAAVNRRPIIFPLSNPTSKSEAVPAEIAQWTEDRAIVATGSPFPGVDQCNNSYIFPGMGLGVLSVNARRVTDAMFMAAAKALALMSPARQLHEGRLLPPLPAIRDVSVAVAHAVARQAMAEGHADHIGDEELTAMIRANVWNPVYRRFEMSAY